MKLYRQPITRLQRSTIRLQLSEQMRNGELLMSTASFFLTRSLIMQRLLTAIVLSSVRIVFLDLLTDPEKRSFRLNTISSSTLPIIFMPLKNDKQNISTCYLQRKVSMVLSALEAGV